MTTILTQTGSILNRKGFIQENFLLDDTISAVRQGSIVANKYMRQHHVSRVRTHFGHNNFPYFIFLQSLSGAGVNGSSVGPFATTLPYADEIKYNVKNCNHLRLHLNCLETNLSGTGF